MSILESHPNENVSSDNLAISFFYAIFTGRYFAGNETNLSLQTTKTELEIAKLKKEIAITDTLGFIQLGTLIITLLAVFISFWSAMGSQKAMLEASGTN